MRVVVYVFMFMKYARRAIGGSIRYFAVGRSNSDLMCYDSALGSGVRVRVVGKRCAMRAGRIFTVMSGPGRLSLNCSST